MVETECAVFEVLGLEELREEIIGHIIGEEVSTGLIGNLRLVQKSWLRSVTKVVRDKKQALFKLELTKSNSINGQALVVEKGGKLLDRFVNGVTNSKWFENGITPTFSLIIREEYFRQENLDSLINCLTLLGDGLSELEIYVPANGGSLPSLFPRFKFSQLSKLTVNIKGNQLQGFNQNEEVFRHSSNVTYFLQFILNAAESLERVVLPFECRDSLVPSGFHYLNLSESLVALDFRWKLASAHLEALLVVRNRLPNLKRLVLLVTNSPYEYGLLFKLLDQFRKTLEVFNAAGICLSAAPRNITFLRLPVMEKLETCQLYSTNLELEPGLSGLEKCLPKLRNVGFMNILPNAFHKWTDNSRFSSVNGLALKLVKEHVPQTGGHNYVANLDLEIMQNVKMAFPNVRRLELDFSLEQTCGLKFVISEMTQLNYLRIGVSGSRSNLNSDFWDALLIGAPIEFVTGLRATSGFWEKVELNNDDAPSIKRFSELTRLDLHTYSHSNAVEQNILEQSLISELVFHFAFLKMPKLRTLVLMGRFSFPKTSNIAQKWISQQPGRKLLTETE